MYIAVDGSLPSGLAAAQSVHAALQFAHEHPDLWRPWQQHSQYLVVVTVTDEVNLIRLASYAYSAGLAVSTWSEPDLADRKTAVALEPGPVARRLCANLPLLGRSLVTA